MITGYGLIVGITAVVGFENSNFCWYFLLISLESFEKILNLYFSGGDGDIKFASEVIWVKET